jgi:hypothetical protein
VHVKYGMQGMQSNCGNLEQLVVLRLGSLLLGHALCVKSPTKLPGCSALDACWVVLQLLCQVASAVHLQTHDAT